MSTAREMRPPQVRACLPVAAVSAAARVTPAEVLTLQIRELLAFDALKRGQGLPMDANLLRVSCSVSAALARMGYGPDELQGVRAAALALGPIEATAAGRLAFSTPGAVDSVRWLLSFHDAQRAAVLRRDYLRALAAVRG